MINIISSCTNNKNQPAQNSLKIENYGAEMQLNDVIKIWNKNISDKKISTYKANELYKGGSWKATKKTREILSTIFKTNLYIASAGHGLIHEETSVCSYNSTFASSTANSISKFMKDNSIKGNTIWWNSINKFDFQIFTSDSIFFIILPHNYLLATQETIHTLIKNYNDNVFIFTANKHSIPSFMQNNIIKFDSRFNNFQSGVISNMLQRAVLWLANEIVIKNLKLSHNTLQNHIELEMSQYDNFTMPIRIKLSEEEIIEIIKNMILNDHITSASKGLKVFRNNGYACEQNRFSKLFKKGKGN